jgi:mRNA interferase HigB
MRVIAPSTLKEWGDEHPRAKNGLEAWMAIVEDAHWLHPPDMLKNFPKADPVTVESGRKVYVFNIRQNEYRLVCAIHFETGIVFTLRFMKHQEYEKGAWKSEL